MKVGDYAVVVDFDCCEGFEEGTCVEIVEVNVEIEPHDYTCKSHSPEKPYFNINMYHCDKCLHPIKKINSCPNYNKEVTNEL